MKKIYYISSIIFFVFFTLISCEDDTEVCGEGTTPRLIIKFYNQATNEVSSQSGVISTTEFNNYSFSSQDSIQIPLSLKNEVDTLFYKTSTNAVEIDTITFTFTRKEEYVSKGCGFRVDYTDVNAVLETTGKNIKKLEFNPNLIKTNHQIDIVNEAEAHMFVYF
ncbi:MAG: DUF6452 family protein [Flavobacteriales bacterium]